jgi:hypothetical protein
MRQVQHSSEVFRLDLVLIGLRHVSSMPGAFELFEVDDLRRGSFDRAAGCAGP